MVIKEHNRWNEWKDLVSAPAGRMERYLSSRKRMEIVQLVGKDRILRKGTRTVGEWKDRKTYTNTDHEKRTIGTHA